MRRTLTGIATSTGIAVLAVLAVTGCGDDDAPGDDAASTGSPPGAASPPATSQPAPSLNWQGPVEVDFETGEVTAPGFNDVIDADAPSWADSPLSTVTALLHLDEAEGTVETDEQTSEDGNPVVVATISGLPDASVAAERYEIELEPGDDGRYRFVAGQRTHRCQPDRGHQDFAVEPCV